METKHPQILGKMEIQYIELSKIQMHPSNKKFFSNSVDANQAGGWGKNISSAEELLESIKKYGIHTPIVLTKDFKILSGHRRYQIAIKLGLEKVPCIVSKNELTQDQEEILIIDYNIQGRRLAGNQLLNLRKERELLYSKILGGKNIFEARILDKGRNAINTITPKELSELTGVSENVAKNDLIVLRRKSTKELNRQIFGEKGIDQKTITSVSHVLSSVLSKHFSANKQTKTELNKKINDFIKKYNKQK